jgi:hypothetical protein
MLLVSLSAGSQAANASTSAGGYDGPAALPRVLIQTAMANTPAPGITITVNNGENLQAALNNARCGDTIRLQAGATFTGLFTFPNKNCDDAHWIIVRTSSDDSLLPAEGSRLNPCYAGVSSLPGRPAFNCSSTRNVLAKLIMNRAGGSGPVYFAPGAGHYRLIGLENILMGGGAATYTPADIEITHNHLFKPLTWMRGQPGYVGGANGNPFIVKNLFELKNAQRVLFDSNIMENTWGGFSQAGFAILLTPKNQFNLCPICRVTDITIRYNYISHMGAGMQLGNGTDDGALPLNGGRYSIHDDVFDDINGTTYKGPSLFAQVSTGPGVPILHDVTISHITAFAKKTVLMIGDELSMNPPMSNFVFTNNIVNAGSYPVWSTGTDGSLNCAVHDSPIITLNDCFTSHIFSNNAVVAIPSRAPVSTWPTHNFFPTSATAVEFVDYNGGSGGNYQLQSSSPYKGAGTDSKDLGADVPGVNAAIARVR